MIKDIENHVNEEQYEDNPVSKLPESALPIMSKIIPLPSKTETDPVQEEFPEIQNSDDDIDEDQIIKIQSLARGGLVREELKTKHNSMHKISKM